MAGDSETTPTDIQPHVDTYTGLINLLKYGAIAAGAIAFLVILLIYK